MNFNVVYAAATAWIIGRPPDGSAGKNLTRGSPNSTACAISLGVTTPGVTAIFFSRQYFTISGFNPGLTINFAPAATASSTCSIVRTVPAPTNISGCFSLMILIDSAAASVRKVTSAQARPPSQRASARGSASLLSFNTTTGTIPYCPSFSKILFILFPPI